MVTDQEGIPESHILHLSPCPPIDVNTILPVCVGVYVWMCVCQKNAVHTCAAAVEGGVRTCAKVRTH